MPTYDVVCGDCKTTAEVFCSFKEVDLIRCKTCGGPVGISPTAPNVHFKASAGEIRRVECKVTKEDGSSEVVRMRHLERNVK